MTSRHLSRTTLLAGAWSPRCPSPRRSATAQEKYPNRPVEVVVTFGPGGGADSMGRKMSQLLEKQLGVPFPVSNVGGASGNAGLTKVLTVGTGRLHRRHADRADRVVLGLGPGHGQAGGLRHRRRDAGFAVDDVRACRQPVQDLQGHARLRQGQSRQAEDRDLGLRHAGRHHDQVLRVQGLQDDQRAVRQAGRALCLADRQAHRRDLRGTG